VEAAFRAGVGFAGGTPPFQRFVLSSAFRQSLSGRVQAVARAQGRFASSGTPSFELPSLGGDQSVRGFRTDEALGERLWSVQSELWIPLSRHGAPRGRLGAIARNLRVASFYDLGGLYSARGSSEGFRQGCGAGLRLVLNGIVFELDWAYGFGMGALGDGRGRAYFNIRLP
jgi:hemolysin activation/secretion protein